MLCSLFQLSAANAQSSPQRITANGFVTCSICLIAGLCQNQTRFGCTHWPVNKRRRMHWWLATTPPQETECIEGDGAKC